MSSLLILITFYTLYSLLFICFSNIWKKDNQNRHWKNCLLKSYVLICFLLLNHWIRYKINLVTISSVSNLNIFLFYFIILYNRTTHFLEKCFCGYFPLVLASQLLHCEFTSTTGCFLLSEYFLMIFPILLLTYCN